MNHCDLLALRCEGPAASKVKSFAAWYSTSTSLGCRTIYFYVSLGGPLYDVGSDAQIPRRVSLWKTAGVRGFDDLRQLSMTRPGIQTQ